MDASAAAQAVEAGKAARKDYVRAFASAVQRFTAPGSADETLALIPNMLVSEFDAPRAELWLWDETSGSGYLTFAAGKAADHRRDYVTAQLGAIGKVAEARKIIENLDLATFGGEDAEFSQATGLKKITAYPLISKGRLVGVCAIYTAHDAADELLKWWHCFAEISGVAAGDSLSSAESQKTITQLSLLFDATKLLNSTLDLAELLDLILRIARTETKAERGSVFLVDHKNKELWSIVASGLGEHQEIRVPFGTGIAGRVAETGEIVNVADAYTLPFFDRSFDQKFGYRTKSLLCLAIRHHSGEVVGVIQLLNQTVTGEFTKDDEDFLLKLSGHMALALENARLHREAMEKQRMEKELALARSIQRRLLPEAPPIVPGYDISVVNEPCYEVGGDYYDFLNLGPQSLLLVVADVEGKGISSAMVMSNLQATLRALVMHLHSLEVLTLSLNEMMYNDTRAEKYLSIFLGLVDTRRGGLHYINAGHVPPILISGKTGEYTELRDGGIVVGLFPSAEYTRGAVKLEPGDILVCTTDGIEEADNALEEEYGTQRMAECIIRNRHKSAQQIVDAVLADVNAFAKGGKHIDDKVLMIVKCTDSGTLSTGKAPTTTN